ncbi:hypothetical protein [Salinarchaeum laminariae]|uniref:hypothetical protein n=1 Tax=Salinarchaeum laminariae TaxID=869888 RepID=UPI0020BFA69F|nr:hypothetical protein [Salinarchaeum laminariae]
MHSAGTTTEYETNRFADDVTTDEAFGVATDQVLEGLPYERVPRPIAPIDEPRWSA